MARGRRVNRFSRRTTLSIRHSHTAMIIIVVVAFLLVSITVSVAVGLMLGRRADEYERNTVFEFSSAPYTSGDKTVRAVDAYAYSFGSDVKAYIARGVTDLSLCLRGSDGNLTYASSLGKMEGFCETEEDVSLSDYVADIHACGGYVCAYFYVKSFDIQDRYLRQLYRDYEIALINEAARLGVDDIMLVGLEVNDENITEVECYVKDMATAAEDSVLGVLMLPELMKLTEEEIYLGGRVRSVCDYIALDLRRLPPNTDKMPETESTGSSEVQKSDLETVISDMEYYIKAYSMRIVLSKENSSLYNGAKALGVVNIQVIGD